jgi:hypothetical protein
MVLEAIIQGERTGQRLPALECVYKKNSVLERALLILRTSLSVASDALRDLRDVSICCWSQNEWLVRVEGLSQMGSKLENLFFNKHPFARDGLRAECRGGLKGRLPSRGQGAAAVGRPQFARARDSVVYWYSIQ